MLAILWGVSLLGDLFSILYYWQLKGYRSDRFRDFLNSRKGMRFLLSYRVLGRFVFFIPLFFLWGTDQFAVMLIVLFMFDIGHTFYQYLTKQFRRPIVTAKIFCIILAAFFFESALFFVLGPHWFAFFVLIRFFWLGLLMLGLIFPTFLYRRYISLKARKKLAQYPDLTIIGITGSFGKSTTKECLASLLATKFSIKKTPKNINSDFGIARFILNNDFSGTEVFVVEMGAYQRGDISETMRIVPPKIGILTAINEQHLSLFGGIENTKKAKFELLQAIPEDGLAVLNNDIDHCRAYAHTVSAPLVRYGLDAEYEPAFLLEAIEKETDMYHVKASYNGEACDFSFPRYIPDMFANNIAASIIVAKRLGMTKTEIDSAVRQLPSFEHVLQEYTYGKACIIDDSYNSNPDGFKAALAVLKSTSKNKKRIVITRGMIELGERSDEIHEMIAGEISFFANELVLISREYEKPMRKGFVKKYGAQMRVIEDAEALYQYIQSCKEEDCVILFENRLLPGVHEKVMKKITINN